MSFIKKLLSFNKTDPTNAGIFAAALWICGNDDILSAGAILSFLMLIILAFSIRDGIVNNKISPRGGLGYGIGAGFAFAMSMALLGGMVHYWIGTFLLILSALLCYTYIRKFNAASHSSRHP